MYLTNLLIAVLVLVSVVRGAPKQAVKKLSYSGPPSDYDKGYGTPISDYQPYLYEKDGNYPKEYVDVEYDHNKPYDLSKVPYYNRYKENSYSSGPGPYSGASPYSGGPGPYPGQYSGPEHYPRNYENKQYQPTDYNYREKNYEDNYNNYYKINVPYQMRDNRRWDDYGKPDYGKPSYGGKPDYGYGGKPDYGKPDYGYGGKPDYGYNKPDFHGRHGSYGPDYKQPEYHNGRPDYKPRPYRSVPDQYYGPPDQYYAPPPPQQYYGPEPSYQQQPYNYYEPTYQTIRSG